MKPYKLVKAIKEELVHCKGDLGAVNDDNKFNTMKSLHKLENQVNHGRFSNNK